MAGHHRRAVPFVVLVLLAVATAYGALCALASYEFHRLRSNLLAELMPVHDVDKADVVMARRGTRIEGPQADALLFPPGKPGSASNMYILNTGIRPFMVRVQHADGRVTDVDVLVLEYR